MISYVITSSGSGYIANAAVTIAGGGGSGATGQGAGGNGGSGVVILSVPTVYYSGNISGSPTINQTNSVGYTILTYTQSGSYTA